MEKYEVRELLRKLKRLVKLDRYTLVYRMGRKIPVSKSMLKSLVAKLTISEFKFINENEVELVKFISFHP